MTPHILQKIVAKKKQEVALLQDAAGNPFSKKDFIDALVRPNHRSIIAEVKPKSPSQGVIFERSAVPSIVAAYNTNADAISVLCDTEFFGGGYDLLQEVRSLTNKPILAKEFIIDAKQIRQAASHGADAVLLIAAILSPKELEQLAMEASRLGLACLLEVHSSSDIAKANEAYRALPQGVQQRILIGINNRDLDTLEIDLAMTERLAPMIRSQFPGLRGIIAESGIATPQDVRRLRRHVQGFLIGTSILRSKDPARLLASLTDSQPFVKYCGMTNNADIQEAERLSVDCIGLIFVPSSPRHVTLSDAKKLRKDIKHAKVVGVFADMSKEEIEEHIEALRLDFVQLHGTPNIDLCRSLSVPVIQAFRGIPPLETIREFLAVCPTILLDKEDGKDKADFASIARLPVDVRSRVFLAGGLNDSNVADAVAMIHPFAVDCARGIESRPGKKNFALMTSFLSALAP